MGEKQNLRDVAKLFEDKLLPIQLCLFDVDGILTDGRVFWSGDDIGYNRFFHIHDGYGLKILAQAGIEVGIITGGDSVGVGKRFKDLGIKHVYMGNEDKRQAFFDVLNQTGLSEENVLYMGDEFFDLPLLKKAGFSATVPNASYEVKESVDYITQRESGQGCAREVIDILRYAKGIVPEIAY
jgi:3-deoxy-D-manno-octulosonate 8-phosphate phosphatase (KDO 8-P phosphatase)